MKALTLKNLPSQRWITLAVGLMALVAPFLFPGYMNVLIMVCIMAVLSLCWDITGGQMGYNSFGNILFFGVGMYATAVLQVGLFYDVGEYNLAQGSAGFTLTTGEYFIGFFAGLGLAGLLGLAAAAVIGMGLLGLRGHYFAIGSLGLGIAAGEIAAGWKWIGAGSGMVTPLFPGEQDAKKYFFYFSALALLAVTFLVLRYLYKSRFGLVLNAIRDDEDKAEAMGLKTHSYKVIAWCVSGFFTGIAGGIVGNVQIFIDPRNTAFAGATYGVWMVLMAILGGKGTLWGPVIGATLFYLTNNFLWEHFLGWQRVAMGGVIVLIVVFFPLGILGWLREAKPELFGHKVEEKSEGADA